jgi:signal peptidase I
MDVRDDSPGASVPAAPADTGGKKTKSAGEMIRFFAIMIAVVLLVRLFMSPFEVEGRSMSPNLHDHERVFVNRISYIHVDLNDLLNLLPGEDHAGTRSWFPFDGPDRGDVVVLDPPVESTQPFIKRVIGLPGETVTFRDGYVYIDGQRLDEAYIDGAITFCSGRRYCDYGPIPAGMVFVLGDNRENSEDSRFFGPVPIENLIGRAWLTNWPMADIGLVPSYDYEIDASASSGR